MDTSTNYRILRRNTAANRYQVDEEIAYFERSSGHVRQQSALRLMKWGRIAPWIRARADRRLGMALVRAAEGSP